MNVKFMKIAAEQARSAVKSGEGGPFGAVVVRNGGIVAAARNMVRANNDPTAHAEIMAIRAACEKLGRFSLPDCEIYTSCEPCPMCLSALHWARIPTAYYGCTAEDAHNIGFDDQYLYRLLRGEDVEKRLELKQLGRESCLEAFRLWTERDGGFTY